MSTNQSNQRSVKEMTDEAGPSTRATREVPCRMKIEYDDKLILSEQDIELKLKEHLRQENVDKITALEQVKNACPYPGHGVLWKFSELAYNDENNDDNLPEALKDWKVITKASNQSILNKYLGWSFCNPKTRHVVIAHRGTVFKFSSSLIGSGWADVKSVVLRDVAPQMSSAVTFAEIIKSAVIKVNKEFNTHVLISVTGHSLGGWLSQVTTFSMEYLSSHQHERFKNTQMETMNNETIHLGWFHPHTVVFDSPGCKEMLQDMADAFDVCYHGKKVKPETFDITTILSEPNVVNKFGGHFGNPYGIILEWKHWFDKQIPFASHKMAKFGQIFDKTTLMMDNKRLMMKRVVDWPKKGRHQLEPNDYNCCNIFQFTSEERLFVEKYLLLRNINIPAIIPEELFEELEDFKETTVVILKYYKIEENFLIDDNHENLVATVKAIVRFFPKCVTLINDHMKEEQIQRSALKAETLIVMTKINKTNFNRGTHVLQSISPGHTKIVKFQENVWSGVSRLFKEAEEVHKVNKTPRLFDMSVLLTLERQFSISDVLSKDDNTSGTENVLIIIANTINDVQEAKKELDEKLTQWITIIVVKYDIDGCLSKYCELISAPEWDDLSPHYREELSRRNVSFQGVDVKLTDVIGDFEITDSQMIADIIDDRSTIGSAFHLSNEYYIRAEPLLWDKGTEKDNVLMKKHTDYKMVVMSADPGQGKTSLLKQMAAEMKGQWNDKWVVLCNLVENTDKLDENKLLNAKEHDACELMSKMAGCGNKYEKEILKKKLLATSDDVIILLDGFDEISPYYKDTVITLINKMKENKGVHRIVVTTRPHLKQELIKRIEGNYCTVADLSENEKIKVLQLRINPDAKNMSKMYKKRAKYMLKKLYECISSKDLTSNILIVVMFAEIMRVDENIQKKKKPTLDILSLYEQFVKNQFAVHFKKEDIDSTKSTAKKMAEIHTKTLKRLSLLAIFGSDSIKTLLSNRQQEELKEDIDAVKGGADTSVGFVTSVDYGTPIFVHQTFAEYFAAEYLCNNWELPEVKEIIKELYYSPDTHISLLRFFELIAARDCPKMRNAINVGEFDDLRANTSVSRSVKSFSSKFLAGCEEHDKFGRNILHLRYFIPSTIPLSPSSLHKKDDLLGWTPLNYACARKYWHDADIFMMYGAEPSDVSVIRLNYIEIFT